MLNRSPRSPCERTICRRSEATRRPPPQHLVSDGRDCYTLLVHALRLAKRTVAPPWRAFQMACARMARCWRKRQRSRAYQGGDEEGDDAAAERAARAAPWSSTALCETRGEQGKRCQAEQKA